MAPNLQMTIVDLDGDEVGDEVDVALRLQWVDNLIAIVYVRSQESSKFRL